MKRKINQKFLFRTKNTLMHWSGMHMALCHSFIVLPGRQPLGLANVWRRDHMAHQQSPRGKNRILTKILRLKSFATRFPVSLSCNFVLWVLENHKFPLRWVSSPHSFYCSISWHRPLGTNIHARAIKSARSHRGRCKLSRNHRCITWQ